MRNRRRPPRLLVFPAWPNRYLTMLQRAPKDAGYEIMGARRKHLEEDGRKVGRGDVLHVHWTQRVAQIADSEAEAWAGVEEFTGFVTRLKKRGVRVIWTVHNLLPHELRYLEPELALSRFLAEAADSIHVMTVETPQVVEHLYRLPPERLRHIPHFSYLGEYDPMPSDRAREGLGLAPDEPTVLFFGRLRSYKGLETLFSALALLTESGRGVPTLLLAGKPEPAGAENHIKTMLPTASRVVTHFSFVDEEDIPTWFGAADVAVFPFTQILNSGSVHLAATLGVPVVLPDEPHLVTQFGQEPWVRFYDRDDGAAALADMLAGPDPADHAAAMAAFSERLAPQRISQEYLELLDELSGDRGGFLRAVRGGWDRMRR